MTQSDEMIIDEEAFALCRARLGSNFVRVLGYLRDDGLKSVAVVEEAMRMGDAVAMIGPAETIKTDAFDLGAIALAETAEHIEMSARDCVEWRQAPDNLLESVVALRHIFSKTVTVLTQATSPLSVRHPELIRQRVGRF